MLWLLFPAQHKFCEVGWAGPSWLSMPKQGLKLTFSLCLVQDLNHSINLLSSLTHTKASSFCRLCNVWINTQRTFTLGIYSFQHQHHGVFLADRLYHISSQQFNGSMNHSCGQFLSKLKGKVICGISLLSFLEILLFNPHHKIYDYSSKQALFLRHGLFLDNTLILNGLLLYYSFFVGNMPQKASLPSRRLFKK